MPVFVLHVNGAQHSVSVRDGHRRAGARHAVFDASGLRLRTVPFTPERVKAAG